MYRIAINHIASPAAYGTRWCLDSPVDGSPISADELKRGVVLSGWVLGVPASPARIVVFLRSGDGVRYYERSALRVDVVRRILNSESCAREVAVCGFRFSAPLTSAKAVFGIVKDGEHYALLTIGVRSDVGVIEGGGGWLFLDNDTNRSVDQYRGRYLLEYRERGAWKTYLNQLAAAATSIGAKHALLIAPSKEMVLRDFYPYRKGRKTPIEQVMRLTRKRHNVVYPERILRESGIRAFRFCDTHWTPHGAMLAVLEVIARFGLPVGAVEGIFAADRYREVEVSGDLGGKLYPPRYAKERLLSGVSFRQYLIYDNALPNFGRILATSHAAAVFAGTCVIYGSSSSYSMLDYLCRVFQRVIFVHSAGNVDERVVGIGGADYLIAQTNGRFVVRPPIVGYDIAMVICEKVAAMNPEEREKFVEASAEWINRDGDIIAEKCHRFVCDAISKCAKHG